MRRDTNREWQSKSSYRMEDPYQDKRSGKLLGVCKLLLEIYQELVSYSKISQRKKGTEMGKGTLRSIQRVKREYYKSIYTCSTKNKRKILSRNRCFRTCYKRSSILRIRKEIEIYYFFVKDNITCEMKLWNL